MTIENDFLNDVTLLVCSYNTPKITLNLLKSFSMYHFKGQKLLLSENSKSDNISVCSIT